MDDHSRNVTETFFFDFPQVSFNFIKKRQLKEKNKQETQCGSIEFFHQSSIHFAEKCLNIIDLSPAEKYLHEVNTTYRSDDIDGYR